MANNSQLPQMQAQYNMPTTPLIAMLSGQQAAFPLTKLPMELQTMVVSHMPDQDFFSARSTCRELREASSVGYTHRFLTNLEIVGVKTEITALASILQSFPPSQNSSRELTILKPQQKHTHSDWNITILEASSLEWDDFEKIPSTLPSREDVYQLLSALPNLRNFSHDYDGTKSDLNMSHSLLSSQGVVIPFLSCMEGSALRPPVCTKLTSLSLTSCSATFSLEDVVRHYKQTLRSVSLVDVVSIWEPWAANFAVLMQLDLDNLTIDTVTEGLEVNKTVFLEASPSDEHEWLTFDPKSKGKGAILGDIGGNSFTRYTVTLSGEWVKKGLEKILGIKNHQLYPAY